MLRNVLQRSRFRPWMLILVALSLSAVSIVTGQDFIPVGYGTAVLGTIPAEGSPVTYSFNGNFGDLVTIRAVAVTPGADPNLTLFGPAQQQLAFNDNEPFLPLNTAAQIVYRLQASGPHYILVGGTQGDFLLTLDVRPPMTATTLQLDTPAEVTFPSAEPARAFIFNTDPILATSLLVDTMFLGADIHVEVRNVTGQIVSILQGNLDNACISIGPGDELYEVTVAARPEVTGTISITLSNAPCVLGAAPVQAAPRPAQQFIPVPIEGVCAASSPRNVNIRSGPSTNFNVVALLPVGQPIQVIGQNENGSWLAVQSDFVKGWIAASVVVVIGPCEGLPVTPLPATPTTSPTPGLPAFTATPESTAEVTEEPTAEITEEPTAEVTEEPAQIKVGLQEYFIDMPTEITGGLVAFVVTNNGTTEHNFEIEGQGIQEVFETNLAVGETRTMTLDLVPGTYVVYCPVDDHRLQGMELELTVTESTTEVTEVPTAEITETPVGG